MRRLKIINTAFETVGYRIQHFPDDKLLLELLEIIEVERLKRPCDISTEFALSRVSLSMALRRLVASLRIDAVVDVGANAGQFVGMIRSTGFDGTILSVEPSLRMFQILNDVAPPSTNQRNMRCLIGAVTGTVEYSVSRGAEFSSLHKPNSNGQKYFGEWMSNASQEFVEMKTLEEIIRAPGNENFNRMLVKTDTQGHDVEVLKSAGKSLDNVHLIMIEYPLISIYENAPNAYQINEYMSHLGFHMAGLYPITKAPDSNALLECDALFVRI